MQVYCSLNLNFLPHKLAWGSQSTFQWPMAFIIFSRTYYIPINCSAGLKSLESLCRICWPSKNFFSKNSCFCNFNFSFPSYFPGKIFLGLFTACFYPHKQKCSECSILLLFPASHWVILVASICADLYSRHELNIISYSHPPQLQSFLLTYSCVLVHLIEFNLEMAKVALHQRPILFHSPLPQPPSCFLRLLPFFP